jgi:hypothetical protein
MSTDFFPITAVPRVVAEMVPGRVITLATAYAWAREGISGKRLATFPVAGRMHVKRAVLAEFLFGDAAPAPSDESVLATA